MGALAEDEELKALDDSDICDNRRLAGHFLRMQDSLANIHMAGING